MAFDGSADARDTEREAARAGGRDGGWETHRTALALVVIFGLLAWACALLLGRIYVCWTPGLADGSTVPPVAGFRKPYCGEDGATGDWVIAVAVLYLLPLAGLVIAARRAARGRWGSGLFVALLGPAAVIVLSLIARTLPPSM